MDITGAIFDCDGTLLDSMPYWNSLFPRVAARHGIEASKEEYAFLESLSLLEGCRMLHGRFGIGEGPEELFEEHLSLALDFYEHDVRPFAGVRGFLEALAAAGIPLIVASSTPKRAVRRALELHGLDRFFCDIVTSEDTGYRDKEHPDIYLEALRRLGTGKKTTWVFEDAPFAARTAQDEGFPVVALLNDHDGRDPVYMREHSDILVTSYAELSLERLQSVPAWMGRCM